MCIRDSDDGEKTYSSVNAVQLCGEKQGQIKIYPTITSNYFVLSGSYPQHVRELSVEVVDAGGRKIMIRQVLALNGTQTLFFDKRPASGSYFVVIRNKETAEILHLSLIHISEPTRQAEISYAVFCLKKKKN